MLIGKTKFHREQITRALLFYLAWSTALTPAAGAGVFRQETYLSRAAGHKPARMFYPRPGHHVKTLPRGHRAVKVGPRHYHFHKGVFYRPGPGGFVVVAAPVGARVHLLPAAAVMVTIGAIAYWTYAGVYYQKVPDGYMVVTRPVKPVAPVIATHLDMTGPFGEVKKNNRPKPVISWSDRVV